MQFPRRMFEVHPTGTTGNAPVRCHDYLSPSRFRALHIVDGAPGDYLQLRDAFDNGLQQVDFFSTAGAAIRHARQFENSPGDEAWLVNSRLPEMSGADLVRMLRELRKRAVLAIIGDQYDVREEIAAYQAGAAYVSKPISHDFLIAVCTVRTTECEQFVETQQPRAP